MTDPIADIVKALPRAPLRRMNACHTPEETAARQAEVEARFDRGEDAKMIAAALGITVEAIKYRLRRRGKIAPAVPTTPWQMTPERAREVMHRIAAGEGLHSIRKSLGLKHREVVALPRLRAAMLTAGAEALGVMNKNPDTKK